ncbi:MAG: amidohydrolase family protein, partial [Thermoleophilaceae bacterium]|nr:amidohydrolase family protein [Thermoleophilaceae bacterium]
MTHLDVKDAPPAELVIRDAHVVDPRAGIDALRDVLVRGGKVAEVGEALEATAGCEEIDAQGLHALPAFVDPHVHLRTPGREDEEDIASGTRSAAAGGFCAILAMPNTDPVVDSEPILSSLRERARSEAHVPVGFLAAITRGQEGRELTEMGELADAGAVAFSDDGLPVRDANVMRLALQYQRLAGRVLALHEEDAALSGEGVMHEGEVSAVLGMEGVPSVSESLMIGRDAALARFEDGTIHVQHVSARESVEAIERAKADGVRITAEASPHHLCLTHEHVREL